MPKKGRYQDEAKFFRRFGERIRDLRKERDLTQEDMMQWFAYRFYQRIEAGKFVKLQTVLRLADAFEVSLEELFKEL